MTGPSPDGGDSLVSALMLAGGGILTAALGAFAKNFLTASGTDAREMRGELREELKRLRDQHAADQEDLAEMRDDISNLRGALEELRATHERQIFSLRAELEVFTVRAQKYLIGQTEARVLLNNLERRSGLTPTPWPPDDVPAPPRFTDPTGGL